MATRNIRYSATKHKQVQPRRENTASEMSESDQEENTLYAIRYPIHEASVESMGANQKFGYAIIQDIGRWKSNSYHSPEFPCLGVERTINQVMGLASA